ncbi:uncharacterized protein LOC62_02G001891 [Vanrija pseudolonga]|uniref:N-acetyltransferase domain-containing protein n=1 Tax=Vanrija pseudolonga TaxID=143232 RepID=A0AAF1BI47_9TREE|nr:hypothetical protein LOC62_02G001891 [Vanrija pseudolonga]
MAAPAPTPAGYTIEKLTRADLPRLSEIGQAAFEHDTHTRMKMHEKGVTDLGSELEPVEYLEHLLSDPAVQMIKIVDSSGKMVGYSNWRLSKPRDPDPSVPPLDAPVSHPDHPVRASDPPLEQMRNITSGHMNGLAARANATTQSFFCTGISVDPATQARGAGSAMIGWAAAQADRYGARSWVHLSDHAGGVRAFEKHGYKVVNAVTVDLDAYATKAHEGKKWGSYTFRFLVREPQPQGKALPQTSEE